MGDYSHTCTFLEDIRFPMEGVARSTLFEHASLFEFKAYSLSNGGNSYVEIEHLALGTILSLTIPRKLLVDKGGVPLAKSRTMESFHKACVEIRKVCDADIPELLEMAPESEWRLLVEWRLKNYGKDVIEPLEGASFIDHTIRRYISAVPAV